MKKIKRKPMSLADAIIGLVKLTVRKEIKAARTKTK